MKPQVDVRLDGMQKYQEVLDSGGGPMERMLKRWALRFRAFVQDRYDRYSKGGGNWAPLKYRTGSILRDTNTMFKALNPVFLGAPGQHEESVPGDLTIEVGYGTGATHPKARMSVARLAEIHQLGLGVVPRREIIVNPDDKTLSGMTSDAEKALRELSNETDVL